VSEKHLRKGLEILRLFVYKNIDTLPQSLKGRTGGALVDKPQATKEKSEEWCDNKSGCSCTNTG